MSKDEKSNYYDAGGIEVFEVIRAKLTDEQFKGFLLGNAIKYSLRCNWKGTFLRDIEKCSNYSKWLKEFEEKAEDIAFIEELEKAEKEQ